LPPEGRIETAVNVVKGLTLGNLLVIFLILLMGIPTYVIWRALDDDKLMDRFTSTYEQWDSQQAGCVLRHFQERGGPDNWAVSSGFALQGSDRWFVSVLLSRPLTPEEIVSYCESLKLIADKMLDRGADRGNGSSVDGAVP